MERLDCAVIGAGVIGLAVARRLAMAGREVVVVEAEKAIGTHTSSRNSEVIHAGLYYPTGSLKAKLCVEGRKALYAYAAERGVAHRRIGKVLVAVHEAELPALERYRAQAEANGVTDLVRLDQKAVRDLEPEVECVAGLLSPSTGIIDSHGLMLALKGDAERAGANVVLASPVTAGRVTDSGIDLALGGSDPTTVRFRAVANAAGLFAQTVARSIAGLDPSLVPGPYFARGHYFLLSGRSPFRRLVYPMPTPGGLGTHVTLDLGGAVRFGPDVSWTDRVDYTFDERRAESFYTSIRQYYPALADRALEPGFVGIRPKLGPPGSPASDFVIQGPEAHGVPGLVNLLGIESPGLTSCLAIADEVASRLCIQ